MSRLPTFNPREIKPSTPAILAILLRLSSKNSRGKTSENLPHVALLDLPFPLGYKGLPPDTVRACLAWCDAGQITGPIETMWNVTVWVLDHFQLVRYKGPLYQKVRQREK